MERFFTLDGQTEKFILFSGPHWTAVATILLSGTAIYLFRKKLTETTVNKAFRLTAAVLLLLQELLINIWEITRHTWTLQYSLPIHICDISVYLCAIMLITRSYRIFEVVYFWGMGGAVEAVLTPDLGPFSFPHFVFYEFFTAHGLVILACLFMIFTSGFRPRFGSTVKAIVITNLYAGFAAIVNHFTGGNYLYLSQKPEGGSLLDFLGPWPWYLLSLEGVLVITVALCSLPFAAVSFLSRPGSGRPSINA